MNLMVNNMEWSVKKSALVLVSEDKRKYHVDDIAKLEKLMNIITTTFVQRGKRDTDRWTCECGKVNKSNIIYCKSCEQDDRGFKKGEVSVEETLDKLKEKLYVLKHIFRMV